MWNVIKLVKQLNCFSFSLVKCVEPYLNFDLNDSSSGWCATVEEHLVFGNRRIKLLRQSRWWSLYSLVMYPKIINEISIFFLKYFTILKCSQKRYIFFFISLIYYSNEKLKTHLSGISHCVSHLMRFSHCPNKETIQNAQQYKRQ